MSDAQPIKLPDKARLALAELFADVQQAQKELVKTQKALNGALVITCDMVGLDAALNHGIDFEKGIITPATATAPTLVKGEEQAS